MLADLAPGTAPTTPFQVWERRALNCTVLAGVVVAWAPLIPAALRDWVLLAALLAWTGAVVVCLASGVRALPQQRPMVDRQVFAIAAVGAGVALLLSAELELIRRLGDRPALTWIHDWRWALNHAQAIARTGSVEHALDYAGVGLDYHVGPAWLAAAVQRITGAGLTDVLFGVIPVLCAVCMILGGAAVLRASGIPAAGAFLAVCAALTLPMSDRSVLSLGGVMQALHSAVSWPFLSTDMMLNSLFGFAVGTAALARICSDRDDWRAALVAAFGLAAVLQIKPQYFVGFGLLAVVMGTVSWVAGRAQGQRTPLLVIAAAASLVPALLGWKLLPGDLPYLAKPVWTAGGIREPFVESLRVTSILGLAAVGGWMLCRIRHRSSWPRVLGACVLPAGIAVGVLGAILYFADFPYRPDIVGRLVALGVDARSSAVQGDDALSQALEPPRLFLLSSSLAALGLILNGRSRAVRRVAFAVALAIVLAPVPLAVSALADPPADLAVAEDEGLWRLLSEIPRDGALLVSSDLADVANSNKRALRAPLLTAYGGHAFWVSNLRYVHYARPDALDRLRDLRRLFGTPWSAWQEDWLVRTGVTHLLVNDRCPAVWEEQPAVPLRLVGTEGGWRAYRWTGQSGPPSDGAGSLSTGVHARFGRSACLAGAVKDEPPMRLSPSGPSAGRTESAP
jgi:hypothetical protein